jgi:hypothetical protein
MVSLSLFSSIIGYKLALKNYFLHYSFACLWEQNCTLKESLVKIIKNLKILEFVYLLPEQKIGPAF